MVEHRLRPQPVHQAVERLGGGALEKGVGLSGGAHAVHDIRPRQVLVHHGAGGVHVVLKVGVHGYGHVRPAPGGHEPGQQGVLVPFALEGVTSLSVRPLRMITGLGFLVFLA